MRCDFSFLIVLSVFIVDFYRIGEVKTIQFLSRECVSENRSI